MVSGSVGVYTLLCGWEGLFADLFIMLMETDRKISSLYFDVERYQYPHCHLPVRDFLYFFLFIYFFFFEAGRRWVFLIPLSSLVLQVYHLDYLLIICQSLYINYPHWNSTRNLLLESIGT